MLLADLDGTGAWGQSVGWEPLSVGRESNLVLVAAAVGKEAQQRVVQEWESEWTTQHRWRSSKSTCQ